MHGLVGLAICGSYPEFPYNCLRGELALIEDVLYMFVYGADVLLEEVKKVGFVVGPGRP